MTDTEIPDGDFVLITTPAIALEQRLAIGGYVEQQLAAGKPIILEHGFNLEVRRLPPTVPASEHYARVNELLEANNAYQERYRTAERRLRAVLGRIKIRTGDRVFHRPSEETWVVAYADYATGKLSACGWPDSEAAIADCDLLATVSEDEYRDLLAKLTERRGDRARAIAAQEERP